MSPGPIGLGPATQPRKGDFIITASGTHFWPLDPRPEDILIADIAHSLAQTSRWGGHAPVRYSVAQHSLFVAERARQLAMASNVRGNPELIIEKVAFCGLLHDASEAYLVDVPTPIKKHLLEYYKIEAYLNTVIGIRFNCILEPMSSIVRQADLDMLVTEASVFFPNETWWQDYGGEVLTGLWTERLLSEIHWKNVRDEFFATMINFETKLARKRSIK